MFVSLIFGHPCSKFHLVTLLFHNRINFQTQIHVLKFGKKRNNIPFEEGPENVLLIGFLSFTIITRFHPAGTWEIVFFFFRDVT